MKPPLLLILFLTASFFSFSQVSDYISVRKKNGRLIKSFFHGSKIIFKTKDNYYVEGDVKQIKNDSVFVTMYTIQPFITNMGFNAVDTVGKYVVGVDYKEISGIKVFKRYRFIRGKIDKILRYGGAGYFALNIINSALDNKSVTGKKNVKSLSVAAGAFGLGFILNKYFPVNRFSRKRHRIVYVKLT